MAIEMIENFDMGTQIKVIGVGGGGGNAVEHMIQSAVGGALGKHEARGVRGIRRRA